MLKKSKAKKQNIPAGNQTLRPAEQKTSEVKLRQARAAIKRILGNQETVPNETTAVRKIAIENGDQAVEIESKGREETVETQEKFNDFYKSEDDENVDMTTIERKDPRRRRKIVAFIIFILLVLLAAALAGFYFFVHRGDKFNEENIVISPQTPLTAAASDQFDFTLEVTNKGSVAINQVVITLQAPPEFIYSAAEPQPSSETKNAWLLGTIKGGSAKKVTITGALTGEKGAVASFNAVVAYRPADFNSDFSRQRPFSVTITDAALTLDLSVPTKVVSGRSADYQIKYVNNAKEPFQRVRLTLVLPDDFTASSFTPAPTKDNNVWEFDKLDSRASGTVSFKGVISAAEGSAREIKAEIGYLGQTGQYQQQNEETSIVFVVNPQLVLTLAINDSMTNQSVNFGDQLNYVLKYRNDSQSEIKNMTLTVELNGEVLNWESLVMSVSGDISNNRIAWSAKQIPALKSVKPGAEGEVMFSVKTKDTVLAKNLNDKNYSLISTAMAVSQEVVDMEGTTLEVESNSITTKLNSRLDLRAEGRYYDDQFVMVGQGPLPPEVGSATTYQIYWYVRNNANEVKEVTIKATVPDQATWANDATVSSGNLAYDPATRTVTWTINKIPPQVGQSIPELEARFAITITPQAADLGSFVTLLETSEISGFDTFTEQNIVKTQAAITTDLSNDPQGSGKGLVVSGGSDTNANDNINGL